jgi:hypothetical protein
MTCRIEVFVRSGHTIDLSLEDGEDRVFTDALHEAWASPEAIGFTQLALGENADSCRAAAEQPPPEDVLARSRRAQRAEQAAPYLAAPAATCLAQNPAALAHPPRRSPLDLPAPTTRTPTHPTADPGPGAADGRENPRYVESGIMWSRVAEPVTSRSGARQGVT